MTKLNIVFTKKVESLIKDHSHVLLLDIIGEDIQGKLFLNYFFYIPDKNEVIKEQLDVTHLEVHSLQEYFENASLLEQLNVDLFGIKFVNNTKSLFLSQKNFHPLRKDSVGQWNPEKIEIEKLTTIDPYNNILGQVEVDDDQNIKNIVITKGLYHRGIEKEFERLDFQKVPFLLERINFEESHFFSTLYFEFLEDQLEIKVPDKAKAIRMLFLELNRMKSHLSSLWKTFRYFNLNHYELNILNLREQLIYLSKYYSGVRLGEGINSLGGVRYDLPKGWINICYEICTKIKVQIQLLKKELEKHILFQQRLNFNISSAKNLLHYGITGPLLRAHGVNLDLRKIQNHYFYDEIDFEIPIGVNGSAKDLFNVWIAEILESLNIIFQVLDNIPPGLIMSADPKYFVPFKYSLPKDPMELMRYQQIYGKQQFHPLQTETMPLIEGAKGILGMYIHSNNEKINRMHIKTSVAPLISFVEKDLVHKNINEFINIVFMLNLNLSELEM